MGTMSPEKALELDFFLKSKSYEEYAMKCVLSGVDEFKCPREEFDRFHDALMMQYEDPNETRTFDLGATCTFGLGGGANRVDKPEKSGIMAT